MFDEWLAAPVGAGGSEEQSVDVPGRPEAFTGADAVRYRTRFPDPRDPGDDVAVLELRGLYAHAEVEATGDRLDGEWPVEHDAYFRPLRVPFWPFEENELVVICRSPVDRFGGLHDTDAVPAGQRVPGVWWEARLDSRPLPAIDRIEISPEVTADGARLHVDTTVLTGGPFSDRITYSVRPAGEMHARGMMERGTVETDRAGETTVEHAIDLRDPALWWPRELGAQHRYTVRAKLAGTERTATTGVCTASFEDGALRDTGSAGMGVFASDGTPKAGADALARSFEPVQAFLPDPTPGESEVVVVNGTPKNRSLTLEWAAGDRSGSIDVNVGLRGRWTGGPILVPEGAGTVSLALAFEGDRVTNEYDLGG